VGWRGGTILEKVLIFKPRLDIMFKKGPVPKERGSIEPIRMHWKRFVDKLASIEEEKGNIVKVLELPNWQFTPELVVTMKPDKVYIPHKQSHQFPVDKKYNPQYYMQMVFPWLFQIDPKGWGPDASVWPIQPEDSHVERFMELQERLNKGESKFPQPKMDGYNGPNTFEHKGYVFFPCQIPHDETIRFHSDVSVAQALQCTIDFCESRGLELIIKGHPVNPGSMKELREIGKGYLWADNVNINDLIANSAMVCMVNSGVGMEAILHSKPVCAYGRADYSAVVYDCSNLDTAHNIMDVAISSAPDLVRYHDFINTYVAKMFDSR